MTAVHKKSEMMCNVSLRLPFIIERNCVLYVVENKTEDKVVDRNTKSRKVQDINPLTPNDHYSGCTAPLTSKRCNLYIYSTNTGTEYFKHGIYSPSM